MDTLYRGYIGRRSDFFMPATESAVDIRAGLESGDLDHEKIDGMPGNFIWATLYRKYAEGIATCRTVVGMALDLGFLGMVDNGEVSPALLEFSAPDGHVFCLSKSPDPGRLMFVPGNGNSYSPPHMGMVIIQSFSPDGSALHLPDARKYREFMEYLKGDSSDHPETVEMCVPHIDGSGPVLERSSYRGLSLLDGIRKGFTRYSDAVAGSGRSRMDIAESIVNGMQANCGHLLERLEYV